MPLILIFCFCLDHEVFTSLQDSEITSTVGQSLGDLSLDDQDEDKVSRGNAREHHLYQFHIPYVTKSQPLLKNVQYFNLQLSKKMHI
jgi:hypothetical protein